MDDFEGHLPVPLARRGMIMSSLMTGFTLATTVAEAQVIHTDAQGLVAGEVQIPADGGNLPGYAARPAGAGRFPTVLVLEEVYGINDYLRDVCRRLAKAGYLAVAPEIYARLADMSKMTDVGQVVRDVISKAPDAQIMRDLDSTAAWAAQNGGDESRLGVIGFCRGGRAVWLYDAHNARLKAAVAFYGTLGGQTSPIQPKTALDVADGIYAPLLGLYGGDDPSIPVAQVQAAAEKARNAGKTVEVHTYPGAGHAFHADWRPTYRKEAAEDGWQRTLAWFKKYLMA